MTSHPPDGPAIFEPQEPVPPRSRVPAHVVGVLAGLVVAPLAVGGLVVGAGGLIGVGGDVHGEGLFLLGALAFALWAVLAGALSSLTLAVPALAWFVAAPLLVGAPTLGRLTASAPAGFEDEVRWALEMVTDGGWLVVAGLLLGSAAAIHVARRSGRRIERAEALLAAEAATAPAPPPSRFPAHVGATAGAAVLSALAAAFVAAGGGVTPALVATAVGVGAAAALGGYSTLAPLVAGAIGVVPQLVVQAEVLARGSSRVAELAGPWTVALAQGAGWTVWTMLLLSSLGPWQARRLGRVLERAEIAVRGQSGGGRRATR